MENPWGGKHPHLPGWHHSTLLQQQVSLLCLSREPAAFTIADCAVDTPGAILLWLASGQYAAPSQPWLLPPPFPPPSLLISRHALVSSSYLPWLGQGAPQLSQLLIKTHQLLSLAPHPPYKAIHRPAQQLATCQKTKVDDRPVVVVYWVVGSEKNVLVANTRVCLPSILPFHAPSPADHLTIPHLAATPTRKCPQRVSQNAPEINPARWYIQKELQDRFI